MKKTTVPSNNAYQMLPLDSPSRGTAHASSHVDSADSHETVELEALTGPSRATSAGAALLQLSPGDIAHLSTNAEVPLDARGADALVRHLPSLDTHAQTVLVEIDAQVERLSADDRRIAQETHQGLMAISTAPDAHARHAALQEHGNGTTLPILGQLKDHLDSIEEAHRRSGFPGMDSTETQAATVTYLSRHLLRNEGESTVSRLIGNTVATGVRAGIGTFAGTLARNYAAFAMQRMMNAATAANGGTMPAATRELVNGVGGLLLALPVALQLLGAIRDARNGTATRESTTDRLAHAVIALGATAAAAATGGLTPVVPSHAAVAVYSLSRLAGSIATQYNSNATPSGLGLLASTGAYSVAQGLASAFQDSRGWNAGASSESIRTTRPNPALGHGGSATTTSEPLALDRATSSASADTTVAIPARIARTAEEIRGASHNWPANIAHSLLNASLEIGDDLQFQGIARLMQVHGQRQLWTQQTPEIRAQATAAGIYAALGALRAMPDTGRDGVLQAFVSGVQHHQRSALEGLRMSFSRALPTREASHERLVRSVEDLRLLGHRWTPNAAPGTAEESENSLVAAYIAHALTRLERDQPLARPFGNSLREFATRLTDQALNTEPHRTHAFQTVFSALNAAGEAASALNLSGAQATALESTELAGVLAIIYPLLYGGLLSRGASHEQTEEAAAQAMRQTEALRALHPAQQL